MRWMDYSPEEALLIKMDQDTKRSYHRDRGAFIWRCGKAKDGTSYGSYKWVSESELKGRRYRVFFADCAPAIEWLDFWYNPVTYKFDIPREENLCSVF